MSTRSFVRLAGVAAGAVVALAAAVPASALSTGVDDGGLVHVEDCRTVDFARGVDQDIDFSSNSTGPVQVTVAGEADGSITLCYDLDATVASAVDVDTWTDATVDAVLGNLLGEADASRVCSAVRLQVAPGVTGTVSATSHAYVSVDGAPPAEWDHTFADDVVVDNLGEDIVLKACTDTEGNTSTS